MTVKISFVAKQDSLTCRIVIYPVSLLCTKTFLSAGEYKYFLLKFQSEESHPNGYIGRRDYEPERKKRNVNIMASYIYLKNQTKGIHIYCFGDVNKVGRCSARLHTIDGAVVEVNVHSHNERVPGLTYGRIPCVVSVLKPITFTFTILCAASVEAAKATTKMKAHGSDYCGESERNHK